MKVEYINPFITATRELFQTMMNLELTVGRPTLEILGPDAFDVTGVIGLAGGVVGTVVLRFSRGFALKVTNLYAGMESETFDEAVVDTVGEIVNIISANAKSALAGKRILVSVPRVALGPPENDLWPDQLPRITVPFDCGGDRFTLTVGFQEAAS